MIIENEGNKLMDRDLTSGSVRLYLSTGFGGDNIPDSKALVRTHQSLVFNNQYMRQVNGKNYIKVQSTDSNINDVDYCILNKGGREYCYFVTGFEMIGKATANIYLELDGATTLEVFQGDKMTGDLTRKIKSNSEMQNDELAIKAVLQENYSNQTPLEEDSVNNLFFIDEPKPYVVSTMDLEFFEQTASKFVYEENGGDNPDKASTAFALVPDANPPGDPTIIDIYDLWGGVGSTSNPTEIPGFTYYRYDKDLKKTIRQVWSLGQMSAIHASVLIPSTYVNMSMDGQRVNSAISTRKTITADMPVNPGFKVENKKALYLHQRIKLSSIISGDYQEYDLSQIGGKFEFDYWANPHFDGRPICRPTRINNNTNPMFGAVLGERWLRSPLGMEGIQGEDLAAKAYMRKQTGNVVDGAFSAASAGFDITKMLAGPAAMGVAVGQSIVNTGRTMYNDSYNRELERVSQPPQILFSNDETMQNFLPNGFSLIRTRLSEYDVRKFDEYLHKFGEAVRETYTNSAAHNREVYDYIKVSDVVISTNFPNYITEVAKRQVEGGVRVWHKKIDSNALKIGGNG